MFQKIPLGYLLLAATLIAYPLLFIHFDNGEQPPGAQFTASRMNTISDSLPHYRYQQIADSLQQRESCRKEQLLNKGKGLFFIFPGFTHIHESVSCDMIHDDTGSANKNANQDNYYLVLPAYQVQASSNFYIKQDKYFLETINGNDSNASKRKYISKEIPVRYAQDQQDGTQLSGYVLIPVSFNKFQVIRVIIYVFTIAIALFANWVLLILPLQILYSIA